MGTAIEGNLRKRKMKRKRKREGVKLWEYRAKVNSETDRQKKMLLCTATHSQADVERQVVKCYLECHLAHKDRSKDVVGDG